MRAEFTDDELRLRQASDTPADGGRGQTFEIQADEGETLLRFHEACAEHDIPLSIERLSQQ